MMKRIRIKCEIMLLQEDAELYWHEHQDYILNEYLLNRIPGHEHGEFEVIKEEADANPNSHDIQSQQPRQPLV